MPYSECRVDRLTYGRVPIAWIMSIPREMAPDLFVQAPEFPVSRADALAMARERVACDPAAILYLSKEILRPGELSLQLGDIAPTEGPDTRGSWVGFVDLVPTQNWAHRCLYLFIDSDRRFREFPAQWYPVGLRELFAREI